MEEKKIEQIVERCLMRCLEKMNYSAPVSAAAKKDPRSFVTMREAAEIIGVSESRMRKLRDKFRHIKMGKAMQSRVMFYRDGLEERFKELSEQDDDEKFHKGSGC